MNLKKVLFTSTAKIFAHLILDGTMSKFLWFNKNQFYLVARFKRTYFMATISLVVKTMKFLE